MLFTFNYKQIMYNSTYQYPFITTSNTTPSPYHTFIMDLLPPLPESFYTSTTTFHKHLIKVGSATYSYYLDESLNHFDLGADLILDLIYEAYNEAQQMRIEQMADAY